MSVDITASTGATMDVTNVGWRFIIDFGRRCGWEPLGSLQPEEYDEAEPWDGSYDPAIGQAVSEADAASLGEALKRGLEASDFRGLLSQTSEELTAQAARLGYHDGPAARVTDGTIAMLQQFADLVRDNGGFRIE
ncbi:MAG: hypothetical protein JWN24_2032 [Phycisphaerales bacterium]|nr:hypothetical protein [Phycisphaerales bacterium]